MTPSNIYVFSRFKTTNYQQLFIIRTCRVWNVLVDDFSDVKAMLFNYTIMNLQE